VRLSLEPANTLGMPQDHDAYQKALERLLRDLKVEAKQ
jgi:hypothetical protein